MMNMKIDLRTNAKNIRKNLPMAEISAKLVKLVRECPEYVSAKHVMLFYPTKYEVNLLPLLNDNKNFYFPRVDDNNLLVCPYRINDRLEKSSFNIFEPCSKPVDPKILDIVVVPALMADKNGYRLGYGGGFYDRFLLNISDKCKTLCLLPEELLIDNLPVEEFDVPADIIISV